VTVANEIGSEKLQAEGGASRSALGKRRRKPCFLYVGPQLGLDGANTVNASLQRMVKTHDHALCHKFEMQKENSLAE